MFIRLPVRQPSSTLIDKKTWLSLSDKHNSSLTFTLKTLDCVGSKHQGTLQPVIAEWQLHCICSHLLIIKSGNHIVFRHTRKIGMKNSMVSWKFLATVVEGFQQGIFYIHHPTDGTVMPVVEQWLEQEIPQWDSGGRWVDIIPNLAPSLTCSLDKGLLSPEITFSLHLVVITSYCL